MFVREGILHHAPQLENPIKFLAGFVSGFSTGKPFFWQGMAVCPLDENNIIFRPHSLNSKFDSIEIFVARKKENGTIIIDSKLFEKEIEEIVSSLIGLKEQILRLIARNG